MSVTGLLELGSRVLHAAGPQHGVARCGRVLLEEPFTAGRADVLADRAVDLCADCWPEWTS